METTRKSRLFALQDTRDEGSGVLVLFDNRPFDLQSFATTYRTDMDPYWGAPSDAEFPPGRMQVGGKTFYYYGAGGGGVCYPDKYYFDLKGKTLRIIFDGPCVDDKTPSPETKKIEAQMLAILRTFQARQ